MGEAGDERGAGWEGRRCGSPDLCGPQISKALCTWLFPNHYRRTINYGRSLIAIFFFLQNGKRDNKCMPGRIGVRSPRLGGGDGGGWDRGVMRGYTKQVPIFGKKKEAT